MWQLSEREIVLVVRQLFKIIGTCRLIGSCLLCGWLITVTAVIGGAPLSALEPQKLTLFATISTAVRLLPFLS